ncbi:MAG: ferritin-like domain-containing protein [Pseudomonadota bacterium]
MAQTAPSARETRDDDERLSRLSANARANQWHADDAIDWNRGPRLPFWVSKEKARRAVSQLYHGEIATSGMCRSLLNAIDDEIVRDCLGYQLADELRHASVYARYLDGIGGIAPMDPNLERALSESQDGPLQPVSTILAFHIIVEGEVLRQQEMLARLLPCPLLRQINRLVARDEARHVAFGKIYLKSVLADQSSDKRAELYAWLHRIWSQATAFAANDRSRRNALERAALTWLRGGWRHHDIALRRIGVRPRDAWTAAT